MIGYQRIVTTLGQRLGKVLLTPAQGAAAETVSAGSYRLIRFQRPPRKHNTHRHIGHCGHNGHFGSRLHFPMLSRIVIAWLVTLPVTILIAGGCTIYSKVRPRYSSSESLLRLCPVKLAKTSQGVMRLHVVAALAVLTLSYSAYGADFPIKASEAPAITIGPDITLGLILTIRPGKLAGRTIDWAARPQAYSILVRGMISHPERAVTQ